jgi:flagellar biosynthesis protein FlhF
MAEAMARIRAELGNDALILSTRRVGDGVEVTAALEPDDVPLPLAPPDPERLAILEFHNVPASLHAALRQGDLADALAAAISFGTLPLGAGEPPLLRSAHLAPARH